MPADSPAQINSYEIEHIPPLISTLVDRMMLEVETFVDRNWASIAINDRNKMECLPDDHVAIWVVKPEGSHFIKPFCPLVNVSYQIEAATKPGALNAFEAFFIRCQDCFVKFRNKYNPTKNKYYIVIKRDDGWNGELIESNFEELLDLAFVGQLKWSDCGMRENYRNKAIKDWERNWLGIEA